MSEFKLWHVFVVGSLSAAVGVVVTLHLASLSHWKNDTDLTIKALAGEVERVDKNTQALMGLISGRPPRGSMGVQ